MTSVRYPLWLQAGICVIAALCLIAGIRSYRESDVYGRANQDPYMINPQPQRLHEAARLLPDHSTVGYLSDISFADAPGQAAYFGVAYALAPRLVVRSAAGPAWVLGNFAPLDFAGRGGAPGAGREFGNGVMVFRGGAQ